MDAHELIALCARRPMFIGSGSQQLEGGWVDAKGMFLGAVGAGPYTRCWERRIWVPANCRRLKPRLFEAISHSDSMMAATQRTELADVFWHSRTAISAPRMRSDPPRWGFRQPIDRRQRHAASGSRQYDAPANTYALVSAGANTWYHVDSLTIFGKRLRAT